MLTVKSLLKNNRLLLILKKIAGKHHLDKDEIRRDAIHNTATVRVVGQAGRRQLRLPFHLTDKLDNLYIVQEEAVKKLS